MKNNKNHKYTVSSGIQKLTVFLLGTLFLIGFFFELKQGIYQYSQNPNIGGWYGYFYTYEILPLLLFAVTYFLNPRKLTVLQRSFESILVALVGLIAWALISSLERFIYIPNGPNYISTYAKYEIIASTIFVGLITLFLLWLRSTKKWT